MVEADTPGVGLGDRAAAGQVVRDGVGGADGTGYVAGLTVSDSDDSLGVSPDSATVVD